MLLLLAHARVMYDDWNLLILQDDWHIDLQLKNVACSGSRLGYCTMRRVRHLAASFSLFVFSTSI